MLSLRKKIKKWFYGSCPGFAGSFPYFGTQVYFPKNSLIFHLACQLGFYEKENWMLLRSLVKPHTTYFDVGANIGLMSIPLLEEVKSCQVVSFEPSPNVLTFLIRTVEASSFKERWKLVGKAAGNQAGVLEFFTSNSGLEAYAGFKDTKRGDTQVKIEVPVTTIDIEWNALGKPKVSVIKIDVEGAEIQVLEGAKNCLIQERPFVLLEWNQTNLSTYNYKPEDLINFSRLLQYNIYRLPEIVRVLDPSDLTLYMMRSESFLLAPQ